MASNEPVKEHNLETNQWEGIKAGAISDGANVITPTQIGVLSTLQTTAKTSLVAAINENFTQVVNGKNQLNTAVLDQGGTVQGTSPHSYDELDAGIRSIPRGSGTAQTSHVLEGQTFTSSSSPVEQTGAMQNNGSLNVTPNATVQNFGAGYYSAVTVGVGAGIKSIQRGQTIINSGANAITDVTIPTAVNVNSSVIKIYCVGAADNSDWTTGELISPTLLRLHRLLATNSITVHWEIVEFVGIKSFQKGLASSNSDAPISAVDMNKSMVFFTHRSNNVNTGTPRVHLVSPTSIHVTGSLTYLWQVVEFN